MRQTTFDPALLETKAKLFRGFADLSRLAILETLRDGPRTVGDIADDTGLSQPNVSNHLACLLECGLVGRVQQGRFAVYSLADAKAEAILRISDELIEAARVGIESCSHYHAVPTRAQQHRSARP